MKKFSLIKYVSDINEVIKNLLVTDKKGDKLSINHGCDGFIELVKKVKEDRKKIIIIANGGSVSTASHFQNDLVKACNVRALIYSDQPLLTALANDLGYEHIYDVPFKLWIDKDDLLIIISSSGESKNLINVSNYAQDKEIKIITLTGFKSDNYIRNQGDINFYLDSYSYGIVENAHAIITHFITDKIKD